MLSREDIYCKSYLLSRHSKLRPWVQVLTGAINMLAPAKEKTSDLNDEPTPGVF
jgi:hypothetical protein